MLLLLLWCWGAGCSTRLQVAPAAAKAADKRGVSWVDERSTFEPAAEG